MRNATWSIQWALLLALPGLAACSPDSAAPRGPTEAAASTSREALGHAPPIAVSGSAVHYLTTEIIHSQEPTENGMIQRSTAIVELTGDVTGFVLYHPTSVFDFVNGTLVNTGTQVFSGTIAGSAPVLLHDARFRFDVDLATGETLGSVHFSRSQDAPHKGGWFECDLVIVGTGMTPEGELASDYEGTCVRRGNI